jgi:hypothetical protein
MQAMRHVGDCTVCDIPQQAVLTWLSFRRGALRVRTRTSNDVGQRADVSDAVR